MEGLCLVLQVTWWAEGDTAVTDITLLGSCYGWTRGKQETSWQWSEYSKVFLLPLWNPGRDSPANDADPQGTIEAKQNWRKRREQGMRQLLSLTLKAPVFPFSTSREPLKMTGLQYTSLSPKQGVRILLAILKRLWGSGRHADALAEDTLWDVTNVHNRKGHMHCNHSQSVAALTQWPWSSSEPHQL